MIALDLAKVIVNDLVSAVEHAMALNGNSYAKQALATIHETKDQIRGEYEILAQSYGNRQNSQAYYQNLIASLSGAPTNHDSGID